MRQAAKQTPLGLTKRPPLIVTQRRASKAPVACSRNVKATGVQYSNLDSENHGKLTFKYMIG
jgi:hypothetical protein